LNRELGSGRRHPYVSLGDSTQLDAAYDKVAAEGVSKLAPATVAVGALGTEFQTTGVKAAGAGEQGTAAGKSLADAFTLLPPQIALSNSQLNDMAFALTNLPVHIDKVSSSYKEARGEVGLLNEVSRQTFQIGLPKHVQTFLASIEGLQPLLSAAFSATAVLFLIEALVKGVDKITEWVEHTQKVEAAWADVGLAFHEVDLMPSPP
jgi:hypothetical protein